MPHFPDSREPRSCLRYVNLLRLLLRLSYFKMCWMFLILVVSGTRNRWTSTGSHRTNAGANQTIRTDQFFVVTSTYYVEGLLTQVAFHTTPASAHCSKESKETKKKDEKAGSSITVSMFVWPLLAYVCVTPTWRMSLQCLGGSSTLTPPPPPSASCTTNHL